MIVLQGISKVFYKQKSAFKALDNVSLEVPKGKIYGVIGASGAGKSTLIRCVNLLEKPSEGRIIVDGQDLLGLSRKELAHTRRQIGMIFQHFNLLSSRTVYGNIALSLELAGVPKAKIAERVKELLKLVDLEEKIHDYPASLSGGQKQRVAIARTLANNPKVLLCDEATSALDPATTRSILALLKDINRRLGITILLITHEMDVVKAICDEVAIISAGHLIEKAPVGELFSNPKTELAKQFIASALHVEIPEQYQQSLSPNYSDGKVPLLKLEISSQSATTPVLSNMSRKVGVDFQIVSSQLDHTAGIQFGIMLITLFGGEGQKEYWEEAISFFEQHQIRVTRLGYV
ncbi:MAG TPA: methionine ABC transporter ATP-binding protein MetN [Sphingobacteriaceae bacterium]|nr:methionine ABC transporter ATP-binding protein MetN [Sphingobacteriaceae bacterium]